MNNNWLSDYVIYSQRGDQSYARRACRPLESHIKKMLGLPVSEASIHAEIQYLKIVDGGATCECPACQLRAPGSAGIFWAVQRKDVA
ncbi:MAG: hypothetical protein ACTS2F_17025 [Thainema sp.]